MATHLRDFFFELSPFPGQSLDFPLSIHLICDHACKLVHMKRSFIIFFVITCACAQLHAQSDCKVLRLFTDHQEHSAVTTSFFPHFSWQITSASRGQLQTAYEILVSNDSSLLHQQKGNWWNSGKVKSSRSQLVPYAGKPLQPGLAYYWKMRVWDRHGKVTSWSHVASWRTGLQTWEQWQAQWVTNSLTPQDTTDKYASFQFRKTVALRNKPVRAIAWFCGLGFSELHINGVKISKGLMDPAWTDYRKRTLYQTWDLTGKLQSGSNTFGVLLGNGWYNLPTPDLFAYEKAPWNGKPRFLLRIELTYADGSTELIVSGPDWKSRKSEILFNCIRGGETINARNAMPDWASNGNTATDWKPVIIVNGPEGKPEPQLIPSEKVIHRIKPVALHSPKPGVFVYDLGVHIAGYARFEVSGEAGQKLTLDFDEALNDDGTITVKSRNSHTYGRYQTGELILSGKKRDVFEPRFTYHGFRYVQVRGLQSAPALDNLVGLQVHNELDAVGSFSCSDTLLNKIQAAYVYSMFNSFHGVLTEPAREKINWTQDAHNMIEGAIFNFDFHNFANKWLKDVMDSQQPNGWVPSINPNGGWGLAKTGKKPPAYSDPWWGGVILEIPWILYKYYGDTTVLRNAYQGMKQYVDFIGSTATDQYFLNWGIGDWLEVGAEHKGFPSRTPLEQTSTTAYFHYAKLLSETAALLGFRQDAILYNALAGNIRNAFNKRFFNDTTGLYADDSQTSQILQQKRAGTTTTDQQYQETGRTP